MILRKESIYIIIVLLLVAGYIFSAKIEKMAETEKNSQLNQDKKEDPVSHVLVFPVPEFLEFAGEKVYMDDPDLRERFDNEIIVNTHFHSSTIFMIKKSNRWFPQMRPILKQYGIPEDFLYLSLIESGLSNDKSPAGAVGFWQFLPSTAKELGLEVNAQVDERYDPLKSTEAACKYLLSAKEKVGSWTNTAAAYNIGIRGLVRQLNHQKVDSYYDLLLNDETSRYVFRVLSMKQILENQEKYGFHIPEDELYPVEEVKIVEIDRTIPDLTEFAFSHGINYKILKRHNPWLRKNSLTLRSSGKIYSIKIPADAASTVEASIHKIDSIRIKSDRMMVQKL
jgi:membrane-bound lytic murein transglycosylase D